MGHIDVLNFLLQSKCNPNSTSKQGDSPLTVAKNPNIVKELIQHGVSLKRAFSRFFPAAPGTKPPEPAVNGTSWEILEQEKAPSQPLYMKNPAQVSFLAWPGELPIRRPLVWSRRQQELFHMG